MSEVRVGIVASVDPDTATARVTFPDLGTDEAGALQSGWLHVLQHGSTADQGYWMPNVGAEVMCIMDGSGLESGYIHGTIYNASDAPGAAGAGKWYQKFADGSVIEFDPSSGFTISTGLNVVISAATVSINP